MQNVHRHKGIQLFAVVMLGLSSIASAQDAGDEIFNDGLDFMVTLTIDNYLSWCNVEVGNLAPSGGATVTLSERLGSTVFVDANPKAGFLWGYWTGTDGDTTAAHDKSQLTTVTMTTDKSVLACCPLPSGQPCL